MEQLIEPYDTHEKKAIDNYEKAQVWCNSFFDWIKEKHPESKPTIKYHLSYWGQFKKCDTNEASIILGCIKATSNNVYLGTCLDDVKEPFYLGEWQFNNGKHHFSSDKNGQIYLKEPPTFNEAWREVCLFFKLPINGKEKSYEQLTLF